MTLDIAIVDYGAGNLRSVANGLEHIGLPGTITDNPAEILSAKGVILPGVGSSGAAMAALEERGMVEPLRQVAAKGIPFFGVCIGLQLLLEGSEEDERPCLGIVAGQVKRLPTGIKVPHMGWNQVTLSGQHPIFDGVASGSYFYFVHSYYAQPEDDSLVLGTTDYSVTFCSVLARGNIIATQFHPEKSGPIGLQLYENFVRRMVMKGAVP